jgi:RNA polymerase sigma-70 factor (ECF subfamily)
VVSLNPTLVEIFPSETRNSLAQARAGDAEAFGEICRIYESRLLRQALTLCGNETLAEDLAQDTLMGAWKSLRRYNGRCQFFTWLCAILLHRYRNLLRTKRAIPLSATSRQDETEAQTWLTLLADPNASPAELAQNSERAVLVRRCLQALPRKHQQVIHLRFFVDDSLEGIAAALGCSVGTVKSRLFHALEKLRSMNVMSEQYEGLKTKTGKL